LPRSLTCNVMAEPVAIMLPVRTRGSARPRPSAAVSSRRQVGDRDRGDVGAVRWPQVPGSVRAMAVIVRDILIQDRAQVPRPGDEQPVGDLGPGCAHPALGISVRPRTARRDLHHLDPGTGQHRVERLGELPGPIPDQEQEPGGALPPRSISRFRACCTVTPRPGARSRPEHGRGGCSPRSRRTCRHAARSPRSRRGRSRTPAWWMPGCAGTAATSTGSGSAQAVSPAASAPSAP